MFNKMVSKFVINIIDQALRELISQIIFFRLTFKESVTTSKTSRIQTLHQKLKNKIITGLPNTDMVIF